MSGMLTVVGNPRRRRRNVRRRRKHPRVTAHRRRHRRAIGYKAKRTYNPRRRRRVTAHHRRHHSRRRRHSNPLIGGMGTGTFMKGLTGVGIGAIGARLVSNAIKNQVAPTASPMVKLAIEAGVGVVGAMVVGKFLKQRALANGLAIGAGVIVALDLYELYIKPKLPALLQDYGYGSLNAYEQGALNGWAPQGMSGWAPIADGPGIYDSTVYG